METTVLPLETEWRRKQQANHFFETHSPVKELIKPMKAVGMEATMRMEPMRMRAPYLSHRDPKTKRMTMSKATAKIFDVQISCLLRFRSTWMMGRRGAMANQMKKAMKNPHHEKWKARM